jgi:hypothetical protein
MRLLQQAKVLSAEQAHQPMSALPPESDQVEHWKNYRRSIALLWMITFSGRKPAAPVATCSSNGIVSRHPLCFARERR